MQRVGEVLAREDPADRTQGSAVGPRPGTTLERFRAGDIRLRRREVPTEEPRPATS
jgi:hypothetical protein